MPDLSLFGLGLELGYHAFLEDFWCPFTRWATAQHMGIIVCTYCFFWITFQFVQWDDESIESPSEASPKSSRKLCLPSPEKKAVSPLKKHEITKFSRRRKIRKWSLQEEETLREAVKAYVFACWKGVFFFLISKKCSFRCLFPLAIGVFIVYSQMREMCMNYVVQFIWCILLCKGHEQ